MDPEKDDLPVKTQAILLREIINANFVNIETTDKYLASFRRRADPT